jgi:hypothetical protein
MAKKFNKYGLNHHWISGNRMGQLNPCFLQEVSPGEVFKGNSRAVFRLAPTALPVFMQMKIHLHFFYVPYRLVWDEFPEVWTGEDTSTAWPTISYSVVSTWWHSFGVPINSSSTPSINALPIRAYNLIWNEHFRNPLEQAEVSLDTVGSSLHKVHHSSNTYLGSIQTELAQGGATSETVDVNGSSFGSLTYNVVDQRDAMNRQRYKERRAAYGERYEDVLLNEHGMNINDVRLQKPEHCARARATMGISEVTVTATSTSEESGEYKGHGITGLGCKFPARKFPEPGILMGVWYARPRLQLKSRCDKIWTTTDIEDLYHPHLVSDTQQVVKSSEIYFDNTSYSNFGYVGKYDHLRHANDTIAGYTEIENYTAYKELSSTPTVAYLHQVQEQDHIFQDQTSVRSDIRCMFDHNIAKYSPIPRRKK